MFYHVLHLVQIHIIAWNLIYWSCFCYIIKSILNLFWSSLQSWLLTSYFSQLFKSSEGPLLRRRRHLESSKPYITAKLLSLPPTFTLGDKKNYNGFYNKPLNTDQEYLSFIMAVLQNNETDSTANYVRLTYTQRHAYRLHFKERHLQHLHIYIEIKLIRNYKCHTYPGFLGAVVLSDSGSVLSCSHSATPSEMTVQLLFFFS